MKRKRARRAAACHAVVQIAGFAALSFPAPAFGTRGSRRSGKATDRADKQRKEKPMELNPRNHQQHAQASAQEQQQEQAPSQAGVETRKRNVVWMTRERWRRTHRDFKGTVDGQRMVLHLNPRTGGAELWPVELTD